MTNYWDDIDWNNVNSNLILNETRNYPNFVYYDGTNIISINKIMQNI